MSHDTPASGTKPLILCALLAVLAIFSALFLVKDTDLRVYWYAMREYYSGIRPAYGPMSGVGYPMNYRYPPVTYLMLYPLRFTTVRVAGIFWTVGEWLATVLTVRLAMRRLPFHLSRTAAILCCASLLSYVVLAIRYANIQPFVICALFAGLILAEARPVWSGLLLSLAITFKIWPILFLPWLFPRGRRRAAAYTGLWLAALWTAPVFVFGVQGYWAMLGQWRDAMTQIATTYSEIYYVLGQSLFEVVLRYCDFLTGAFRDVAWIRSISPATAAHGAEVFAAAVYIGVTWRMLRSDRRQLWAWDGAAFVLYSLVEPHAVKSGLISLAPAVLTAGYLYARGRRELCGASLKPEERRSASIAGVLFLCACMLFFLGTVIQYRPWQRFLLAAGLDCWAEMLLLAAFTIWITRTPIAHDAANAGGDRGRLDSYPEDGR